MKRITLLTSMAIFVLVLQGCAALFQPKTVEPIEFTTTGNTENPRRVIVLLPGIRDRIDDFGKHGFIEIAEPLLARRPDTALVAVDAHWGYYRERILVERLNRDLVAKFPGARFTFVGASLGGFGSMLMAMEHEQRVERLVLLAPLLGEDDYKYLERIKKQGFVDLPGDEDLTLALNRGWKFFLDPARKIPVTIGFGNEDSFAPYYAYLIAQDLHLMQIETIPGGHDWDTWRTLWEKYAPIAIQPG